MTIGGTAGIQLLNIDGSPVTQDQLAQLNEAATSHQNFRKKLWCDAVIAYIRTDSPPDSQGPFHCADEALLAFDERFGK